jgi:transposase
MEATQGKLKVHLTGSDREELERVCRKGVAPVAKVRHARILLLADEDHVDGRRPDWQIAEIVGVCERTVCRVRQAFVRQGPAAAVERKARSAPGTAPKLDGRQQAQLVTLCCSTPPAGRSRWTLKLLADELGRLQIVESICPETVRQYLKKTRCSRGAAGDSAFPTATGPVSSRGWKKSWTSTAKRTTRSTR